MKKYKNLSELVKDKNNYPDAGSVYAQKSKLNDLIDSEFWIIPSKEGRDLEYIEDDRGAQIPEIIYAFGVKRILDVQILQDIIDNKLEHNSTLSLDDTDVFLEAIEYYLENDDFLD